jgi:hypothetical protein
VSIANGTIVSYMFQGINAKLNVPNAGSTFTFSGGDISLGVSLGSETDSPTLTINGGSNKTIEKRNFVSYANATWSDPGNLVIKNNVLFANMAGATFDVKTDASITSDGTSAIINFGTFKKTSGSGTTAVEAVFENANQLLLKSGTVRFKSTLTQSDSNALTELNGGWLQADQGFSLNAGTLDGVGQITGNVSSDGGEVIPGLAGAPGTLNIVGNYTMTASSKLTINMSAMYMTGTLNVQGAATLAGTLRVNRDPNATPMQSDAYRFLLYQSATGDFSTFDIPNNSWNAGGVNNLGFGPVDHSTWYELYTRLNP